MKDIINSNGKNFKVDLRGQRVTLLDSRYYFNDQNEPVPSVTTILDAYPKPYAYYEWLKNMGQNADEVRDDAGRRGSKVHAMTEAYDRGEKLSLLNEEGFFECRSQEWAMLEKYVEFSEKYSPEHKQIEMLVVNNLMGGTLDRLTKVNFGFIKFNNLLIDIKTANAIYPYYWLQLAAYKRMLSQVKTVVDGCAILWLNAKTRGESKQKDKIQGEGWQLLLRSDEDMKNDIRLFDCTHQLWLAENHPYEPKQISYNISYQNKKFKENGKQ